jgi:putative oxidoreductase
VNKLNSFFNTRKEYGIIFLRLLIGWRLIDGTQDNIFSWERMLEFRDFLNSVGVAPPLLAAIVSVYAQFVAGICYVFGAFVRMAAIIMIINFMVALIIVHLGTTFQESFQALTMLFGSVFFLFAGAGKLSVDEWLEMRNKI